MTYVYFHHNSRLEYPETVNISLVGLTARVEALLFVLGSYSGSSASALQFINHICLTSGKFMIPSRASVALDKRSQALVAYDYLPTYYLARAKAP